MKLPEWTPRQKRGFGALSQVVLVGIGMALDREVGTALIILGVLCLAFIATWPSNPREWAWLLIPAWTGTGVASGVAIVCVIGGVQPWTSVLLVISTAVLAFASGAMVVFVGDRGRQAPSATSDKQSGQPSAETHAPNTKRVPPAAEIFSRWTGFRDAVRRARIAALELQQEDPSTIRRTDVAEIVADLLEGMNRHVGEAAARELELSISRDTGFRRKQKWNPERAAIAARGLLWFAETLESEVDLETFREFRYDVLRIPEQVPKSLLEAFRRPKQDDTS